MAWTTLAVLATALSGKVYARAISIDCARCAPTKLPTTKLLVSCGLCAVYIRTLCPAHSFAAVHPHSQVHLNLTPLPGSNGYNSCFIDKGTMPPSLAQLASQKDYLDAGRSLRLSSSSLLFYLVNATDRAQANATTKVPKVLNGIVVTHVTHYALSDVILLHFRCEPRPPPRCELLVFRIALETQSLAWCDRNRPPTPVGMILAKRFHGKFLQTSSFWLCFTAHGKPVDNLAFSQGQSTMDLCDSESSPSWLSSRQICSETFNLSSRNASGPDLGDVARIGLTNVVAAVDTFETPL